MINLSLKVIKLLTKKKITLSFAESCTGGLLASSITSISGSSKIFTMGLITYSNNSKIGLLKIPKKTIKTFGAVSYETCLLMVKNLNKISKVSDWKFHDIRRTVATNLSKMGYNRMLIKRILNHADGDVTAIYDRYQYINEKREALQSWADKLDELTQK